MKPVYLPDGRYVNFPDDMSDSEAHEHLMRNFPDLYKGEIDKQRGFFSSFKRAAKQGITSLVPDTAQGFKVPLIAAGADLDTSKRNDAPVVPPETLKDLYESPSWAGVKQYAGETLGGLAAPVAAAGAIGAAGTLGGLPALATTGLVGAAFAPSLWKERYEELVNEGVPKQDAAKYALGIGTAQAGIYATPLGRLLGAEGSAAVSGATEGALSSIANKGALATAFKGSAVEAPLAAVLGAGAEAVGQYGEKAVTGQEIDPWKILEGGVSMGIAGAGGGAYKGISERAGARKELAVREAQRVQEQKRIAQTLKEQQAEAEAEREGIEADAQAAAAREAAAEADRKSRPDFELTPPPSEEPPPAGEPAQMDFGFEAPKAPEAFDPAKGQAAVEGVLKKIGVPGPEDQLKLGLGELQPELPKKLAALAQQKQASPDIFSEEDAKNLATTVYTNGRKVFNKALFDHFQRFIDEPYNSPTLAEGLSRKANTAQQEARERIIKLAQEKGITLPDPTTLTEPVKIPRKKGATNVQPIRSDEDTGIAALQPGGIENVLGGGERGVGVSVPPEGGAVPPEKAQAGSVAASGGTSDAGAARQGAESGALTEKREQLKNFKNVLVNLLDKKGNLRKKDEAFHAAVTEKVKQLEDEIHALETGEQPQLPTRGTDELQPGQQVGYGDMGAGVNKPAPHPDEAAVQETIKQAQEALAKEAALPRGQEKIKAPEEDLTPEQQAALERDVLKVTEAKQSPNNPFGKYIRDFGGVTPALEELAFHRAWGTFAGSKDKGYEKGEAALVGQPKEVGARTVGSAEKWLEKNAPSIWQKYQRMLDEEKNKKAAFEKRALHGPKEEAQTNRAKGYRLFGGEKGINKRLMTRALAAKIGDINDIIERAQEQLHVGNEKGAEHIINKWVMEHKNVQPDLENYLKVKGKNAIIEELMDHASEQKHFADFDGGSPVSPAVRKQLEAGNLGGALKYFSEYADLPVARAVSKRLASLGLDVKVEVLDQDHPDKDTGATYDQKEHKITFYRDALTLRNVLHEVTHAATSRLLDEPHKFDLSSTQQRALAGLHALFENIRQRPELAGAYGIKDIHEFVAEAFSNLDFQRQLHDLKRPPLRTGFGDLVKNLWSQLVHTVRDMLGLDSGLTRTFEFVDTLLGAQPKEGAQFRAGKRYVDAAYEDLINKAPKPEGEPGIFGRAYRGVEKLRSQPEGAIKSAIKDAMVWLENKTFNQRYGLTRLLPQKTILENGEVNPAALVQRSEYGLQLASTSLTAGYVDFTEKGMPIVKRDPANNFGTLMESIKALPPELGEDKVRAFNAITTNLSYAEREEKGAAQRAAAEHIIALAKQKIKEAQGLKGYAAERQITDARKRIAMAKETLAEKSYARPDQITTETIAQAKKAAQLPEVQSMLEIVRNMNMHDIDFYEKAGMLSKEMADDWRQNKYYVPLQRVMDDIQKMGIIPNAGRIANVRTGKAFEGSEREIQDTLSNLVKQRMFMTDAAVRNHAATKSLQYLEAEGDDVVARLKGKPVGQPQVVQVWENGEKVAFQVKDKHAYQSFQGLQEQAPRFMDAIESVTSLFREAITLMPDFIARNMFRDSTEAWAFGYTNDNIAKAWAGSAKQFLKSLPGIHKEVLKGGVHVPEHDVTMFGLTGSREMTSVLREKQAILDRAMSATYGTKPVDWADKADRALGVVHHLLQNLTGESELATRERVYQETLKRTGSKEEAIMAATNVLDWRMRGNATAITYAKKLIPFFNSNLQGWYKIMRGLRGEIPGMDYANAKKLLATKLLKMAAASTAYAVLMSDDKDYQQVKKQTADNNWLVPVGDGVFAKFPIPFEIGVVAKTLPENLVRLMHGDQDGKQFVDAMWQAVSNQTPNVLPQVIKPGVEVATNHDFFTGKPIESDSQRMLQGSQRMTDSTSETAKALGGDTLSPLMVDHLLRGYFGNLGTFMISTILDPVLSSEEGRPTKQSYETPGVRAFITNPTQARSTDLLYELRDQTSKAKATYNHMVQEGKLKEAQEFLNEPGEHDLSNGQLMNMSANIAGYTNQLARIRQEQHRIAHDEKLDPNAKAERIEQLKMQAKTYTDAVMKALKPVLEKEAAR